MLNERLTGYAEREELVEEQGGSGKVEEGWTAAVYVVGGSEGSVTGREEDFLRFH